MMILGVDPGLSGALALVSESGLEQVEDMPTLELTRNGKKKREIDMVQLGLLIGGWAALGVDAAYVEQVGPRKEDSVTAAFAFGKGYGAVLGVLAACSVPTFPAPLLVWRRGVGLAGGCGKDAARAKAKQFWPAQGGLFARVKDDGRADAALIGLFGLRRGGEG